ncbi:MAG: hypothetical protein ACOYI4_04170 [Christensenellales bacterium]|jgi:hypothetical protein
MRNLRNSKSGVSQNQNPDHGQSSGKQEGWFTPNQQQTPQQQKSPGPGGRNFPRRPGATNIPRRPNQGNAYPPNRPGASHQQQQRPSGQQSNAPHSSNTHHNAPSQEEIKNILSNMNPDQKQQFETMKNNVSQFEGKSEQELLREVQRLAMKGRQQGDLNDANLDSFANMLSPMLNDEQRKKLGSIINHLKQP